MRRDHVVVSPLMITLAKALWVVVWALLFAALIYAREAHSGAEISTQEKQCITRGWQRLELQVAGIERELLWKGPQGPWKHGAIVILHGGGGEYFQWCVANAGITAAQVKFSELALAEGFAVFLLNSSDRVTDNQGRVCGKVWDDEVRNRPNLDLPFISTVIHETIPSLRNVSSSQALFLAGLSSGGYMTTRAATHFNSPITAFAPVSSGDPYGWHRRCEANLTLRSSVHGAGFDNETGKQITESLACNAAAYPNEKPWDTASGAKPVFRVFRHQQDGINDASCSEKISKQLRLSGYKGPPDFILTGGRRGLRHHLWQEAYNRPILDFFKSPADAEKISAP